MDKSKMLKCLIDHYSKGNQARFAAKLGIPAQNVSAWKSRKTFDAELIFRKCEGVSAEWLLTGEGEMLTEQRQEQQNVDIPVCRPNQELMELCRLLVANYQQRDEVMGKLVSMVSEIK